MAYIVVSDVHLGSKVYERDNRDMFCSFLKWVRGLENKEETIKCGAKDVTIHKPENLILLGDILELWDPRDGNRDNVIGDSILPFSLLCDINCEKIYVIGNHDDSISELEAEVDIVALPNETKFDIYDRHYPYFSFYWDEIPGKDSANLIEFLIKNYNVEWARTGKIEKRDKGTNITISNGNNSLSLKLNNEMKKGILRINDVEADEFTAKKKKGKLEASISKSLKIGKRSYFFLHGHQFDKEQAILAWVSGLIGESWNPLGWFQDLYNILDTKNHWPRNFLIFSLLFLAGGLFWGKFLPPVLTGPITFPGSLSSAILPVLAGIILLFFIIKRFYELSAALFVLFLGSWLFSNQSGLLAIIWGTVTGYFALGSIPGVVAYTQRKFYNMLKSTDKTAEQVITDKYYNKDKDTIEADVVVFGHTHFASSYGPNPDTGNRLFINSGCFYGKDKPIDGKMRYANTFIYIDDGGAYIMRWQGEGKIECIEAFPAG